MSIDQRLLIDHMFRILLTDSTLLIDLKELIDRIVIGQ